jgi:regulatory protein
MDPAARIMQHAQERSTLAKARAYCARQERAQQEVRDKLYAWEVPAKEVEPIISQLISEGYLNEARFAEHYAVSKFRQKGWGLRKIEAALKHKQVSPPCIALALRALDVEEYDRGLQQAVERKWERLNEPDAYRKHQKLMRYFLGRGYSADAVERALRRCADPE